MASRFFGNKRPYRGHLLRSGVGGEVADLRKDVREAFEELEAELEDLPSGGGGGGPAISNTGVGALEDVPTTDDAGTPASRIEWVGDEENGGDATILSLVGGTNGRRITIMGLSFGGLLTIDTNDVPGGFLLTSPMTFQWGTCADFVYIESVDRWLLAGARPTPQDGGNKICVSDGAGGFAPGIDVPLGGIVGKVQAETFETITVGIPEEDGSGVLTGHRFTHYVGKARTESTTPTVGLFASFPPDTISDLEITVVAAMVGTTDAIGRFVRRCAVYSGPDGHTLIGTPEIIGEDVKLAPGDDIEVAAEIAVARVNVIAADATPRNWTVHVKATFTKST